MLHRVASTIACGSFIAIVAACGSDAPDQESAIDEALSTSRPFVLIPAAPDVSRVCSAELGTTYCSASAADAAAKRCHARLDPKAVSDCARGECTLTYAAERTTCRAGPTYPAPASCDRPQPDDCSFYRSCLDATHPCGEAGYALAYGERLCYAFVENRRAFSVQGQRWLREVRSCLQRELVPLLHEPATCASLRDEAYATHPGCYTAPDNSICSLPPGDVVELVKIIGADLFTLRALAQIREVATTCGRRLFGADDSHTSSREFFRALEAASLSDAALQSFVGRDPRASAPGVRPGHGSSSR